METFRVQKTLVAIWKKIEAKNVIEAIEKARETKPDVQFVLASRVKEIQKRKRGEVHNESRR